MFGLGRFFVYKRYWIPFGLFLGFTLLWWKGLSIESKNLPDMLSERQLPKFTLPLINDPMKMITEEELKGQVGLIHVWATWCSVCLQEHAELLSLTKRYPDYPIYGINFQDEPEAVLSWLSSQGNPFKLSMSDEEGHLGFAYIGFDAISTTAEECKNPQRDLPRGMMYAIIICTVLYVLHIALVLTGMVKYTYLKQDDPLAYVFGPNGANLTWISGIIALSAVVAMASVMLVFQLGQPRIWMSMSRDGLLPKAFSKIHPRYKTPSFATIITGLCVIIPMLFIPSDVVLDLCSMGTLFAFVVVCGGVIKLHNTPDAPKGKFQTPYINAKFVFPALLVLTYLYITKYQPAYWGTFANQSLVENFPMILFALVCLVLVALGFKYNMSLIPVLGLVFCFYMMAQIPSKSWFGFIIWEGPFILIMCRLDANIKLTSRSIQQVLPLYISSRDPSQS